MKREFRSLEAKIRQIPGLFILIIFSNVKLLYRFIIPRRENRDPIRIGQTRSVNERGNSDRGRQNDCWANGNGDL
jgi:hypothetical protein